MTKAVYPCKQAKRLAGSGLSVTLACYLDIASPLLGETFRNASVERIPNQSYSLVGRSLMYQSGPSGTIAFFSIARSEHAFFYLQLLMTAVLLFPCQVLNSWRDPGTPT